MVDGWWLAVGGWRLMVGGWWLAVSGLHFAVCGLQLAIVSCFAVGVGELAFGSWNFSCPFNRSRAMLAL